MKTLSTKFILLGASILFLLNGQAQNNNQASVWVTINDEEALPTADDDRLKSSNLSFDHLIQTYTITDVQKALPDSKQTTLQKVYEITCECNGDALIQALSKVDVFAQAEPAPQYELLNSSPEPDDYNIHFSEDYALDLINAQDAWNYSTGDPQIVLGVSDGSFLSTHEDLENQYVSMLNSQGVTMYYYYHGTAVATGVAGSTNNGTGKSAIGYNCKLALSTIGYNQMLQLAYGGARVINASWSSGCMYSNYYQLVIDEISDLGTIIVASAGNGGTCGGADNLVYPSALDGVISVTSVGPNDNHERTIGDPTTTHQHNATVDICAPGYDVALTIAPGVYMTGNGTSFASPYVTGTIGLMLSLRPCLTPEQIENILKVTATDIYGVNPADYYGKLGAGRLDAGAALEYVYNMLPCSDLTTPTTVGSGVGVMTANNSLIAPLTVHENDNFTAQQIFNNARGENPVNDIVEPFTAAFFPNPTNHELNIRWNQLADYEVQVFGSTGALIDSKHISRSTYSTKLQIVDKGIYMIRIVQNGDVVWNEKVIRL